MTCEWSDFGNCFFLDSLQNGPTNSFAISVEHDEGKKSEGIIYKIFQVVARNLSGISKKKKKTHVWTENFLHLFIFSVFLVQTSI